MFSLPSLRDIGYMALELVCLLLLAYFWGLWQHHEGVTWQKDQQKQAVITVQVVSGAVTHDVVTRYIPKIEYVKGQTVTITKKVPIYVTRKDDLACPINNGFVSLWNATNKMQLPTSSGAVDEGPSPVVLSDIAAEHTREAGICTATENQRDALKEWILGQQKAYSGK